ncbi:hypothetical protein C8Q70DRAFT_935799 [Cubamyces menziesii]|nr:hypothetical protein C8Q70DRAFT_935799 [Cubamyces menziesii]
MVTDGAMRMNAHAAQLDRRTLDSGFWNPGPGAYRTLYALAVDINSSSALYYDPVFATRALAAGSGSPNVTPVVIAPPSPPSVRVVVGMGASIERPPWPMMPSGARRASSRPGEFRTPSATAERVSKLGLRPVVQLLQYPPPATASFLGSAVAGRVRRHGIASRGRAEMTGADDASSLEPRRTAGTGTGTGSNEAHVVCHASRLQLELFGELRTTLVPVCGHHPYSSAVTPIVWGVLQLCEVWSESGLRMPVIVPRCAMHDAPYTMHRTRGCAVRRVKGARILPAATVGVVGVGRGVNEARTGQNSLRYNINSGGGASEAPWSTALFGGSKEKMCRIARQMTMRRRRSEQGGSPTAELVIAPMPRHRHGSPSSRLVPLAPAYPAYGDDGAATDASPTRAGSSSCSPHLAKQNRVPAGLLLLGSRGWSRSGGGRGAECCLCPDPRFPPAPSSLQFSTSSGGGSWRVAVYDVGFSAGVQALDMLRLGYRYTS